MNLIIPMAGQGKRMRPHTFTTIKPLISIAGVSIIEHLITELFRITDNKIKNIGYVLNRDYSNDSIPYLIKLAEKFNASPQIYFQKEPEGTAAAILCAEELLTDRTIIAFCDTIFKIKNKLDTDKDAIVFTKKVKDPRNFGIVLTGKNDRVIKFIEKPKDNFISNNAIIGVYYIKKAESINKYIHYIINNKIINNNEYQLTDALEFMNQDNSLKIYAHEVEEWLDCGNKDAVLHANKTLLDTEKIYSQNNNYIQQYKQYNSYIIAPVFIDNNVIIKNSVIGPYVSIHDNSSIQDSRITNSIIRQGATIKNSILSNSIIGSYANYIGKFYNVNVGDYSSID